MQHYQQHSDFWEGVLRTALDASKEHSAMEHWDLLPSYLKQLDPEQRARMLDALAGAQPSEKGDTGMTVKTFASMADDLRNGGWEETENGLWYDKANPRTAYGLVTAYRILRGLRDAKS